MIRVSQRQKGWDGSSSFSVNLFWGGLMDEVEIIDYHRHYVMGIYC